MWLLKKIVLMKKVVVLLKEKRGMWSPHKYMSHRGWTDGFCFWRLIGQSKYHKD